MCLITFTYKSTFISIRADQQILTYPGQLNMPDLRLIDSKTAKWLTTI